jgi:hypothetical protein
MAKMLILVTCLITIENVEANMYCQAGISLLSFFVLVLARPFKLWSIYFLDVFVELVDLAIVGMNVILIYKAMG